MLELKLLGNPQILLAGRPVNGLPLKSQALLFYLAVTGRPQSRLALAGLLWPDKREADALANLRQVLYHLRNALPDYLAINRLTVALNPARPCQVDAVLFETEIADANPLAHRQRAVDRYAGEFLANFQVDEAEPFTTWAMASRERLHHLATTTQRQLVDHSPPPTTSHQQIDWGDAPDPGQFLGREAELQQLQGWVTTQACRIVAVLGIGGVGKTAVAVQLVRTCLGAFDVVIWRSLLNAPKVGDLLKEWLRTLSQQQLAHIPERLDEQLRLLFDYLRQRRCLLILDNAEGIMQGGEQTGHYRDGYAEYSQLWLRLGQVSHQSCLLLTSREKPREVARLEVETPLVRSLSLLGLDVATGHQLLAARGLRGSAVSTATLVQRYSGNPLALKLVAYTVAEMFAGDVAAFLANETLIFADIRDLLDQQFGRLAPVEQTLLLWLAIAREPATEAALWQELARMTSKRLFLEAIHSLARRSLLENLGREFGLQNVVIEYLTDYLVTQICEELITETPNLLHSHALLRTQAKEYVRQSQQRMFLQPVGERLLRVLGSATLATRCRRLLATMRQTQPQQPSFLAGNLLNLLLHVGLPVTGYNFSELCVWQANLRGVDLPAMNFAQADLSGSVFTDYAGAVATVAIHPDGQLLLAGADNGMIYLWQFADRQLIGVCNGDQGQVSNFAFSADGRWFASAGNNGAVGIWDLQSRQALQMLRGHRGGVNTVAFHPTHNHIVASASTDHTVRIWDVTTGNGLHILQPHDATVSAVAFSPDGTLIITGSHDQQLRVWDWQSGQLVRTLTGHTGAVACIAFCPQPLTQDGAKQSLLVSGSYDQTLRFWDVQSGAVLGCLHGHRAPILAIAFCPDGVHLISSGDDQNIRVWQLDKDDGGNIHGQTIRVLDGHYAGVTSLAVHPQAVGAQALLVSCSGDKTVRLWSLPSGHLLSIWQGHSKWLQALVFTAQDRLLVAGTDGHSIRVWDGYSGRIQHTLRGHTSMTEKLAFSPDGTQVASASWDKTGRVWVLAKNKSQHTLYGHTEAVVAVVIGAGPQGRNLIASGGLDQTVQLWDGATGSRLACWSGHRNRVVAFAFHPAGTMLASGSWDQRIGLWDLQGNAAPQFLHGHAAPIECVAFHPTGRLLASGSWDRIVQLWEIGDGQEKYILRHTLRGNSGGLEMVIFSPDGRLLASCDCDNLVCLWEVASGRLLHRLEEHTNWVRAIAFSPDSRQIASGSDDGSVKFWDVATGRCLQTTLIDSPYTGMNITGVTGISDAQKAALQALGAIEEASLPLGVRG